MTTGTATINGQAQFENILINDNFITTTQSNSDLELRANGTGKVIPDNDLQVTGDLTVDGNIASNTASAQYNYNNNIDNRQYGNLRYSNL